MTFRKPRRFGLHCILLQRLAPLRRASVESVVRPRVYTPLHSRKGHTSSGLNGPLMEWCPVQSGGSKLNVALYARYIERDRRARVARGVLTRAKSSRVHNSSVIGPIATSFVVGLEGDWSNRE